MTTRPEIQEKEAELNNLLEDKDTDYLVCVLFTYGANKPHAVKFDHAGNMLEEMSRKMSKDTMYVWVNAFIMGLNA